MHSTGRSITNHPAPAGRARTLPSDERRAKEAAAVLPSEGTMTRPHLHSQWHSCHRLWPVRGDVAREERKLPLAGHQISWMSSACKPDPEGLNVYYDRGGGGMSRQEDLRAETQKRPARAGGLRGCAAGRGRLRNRVDAERSHWQRLGTG